MSRPKIKKTLKLTMPICVLGLVFSTSLFVPNQISTYMRNINSMHFTAPLMAPLTVYASEQDKKSIANSKDKITENKKQISALEEQKKKVAGTIQNLEGLKSEAKQYITEMDKNLSEIEVEIDSLNQQIEAMNQKIAETTELLHGAMQTESNQYASTKLRIKYMYEKGDTSFLDMLLSAHSWSDLLNRAEYIEKITSYDREKLVEYKKSKETVAEYEGMLEDENEKLQGLLADANARQESVRTLMAEKQKQVNAYSRQISSAQSEVDDATGKIKDLYEDISAQEANIAAMEKKIEAEEEAARKAAEAAGKTYTERTLQGGLIWPCPASSTISSYFGARESPTEGASTNHKGIDIAAASGSAVVAAAAGEVVIATYSASAGNYVMISHGSGVYTVYMHMSSLAVSEGMEVKQGQTIGKVGSTGYSTGPHLHFGIRKNGAYVNPLSYVG